MKSKANFYISMFIVLVASGIALWFIMRIVAEKTSSPTVKGTEASYDQLKQSILKP